MSFSSWRTAKSTICQVKHDKWEPEDKMFAKKTLGVLDDNIMDQTYNELLQWMIFAHETLNLQ